MEYSRRFPTGRGPCGDCPACTEVGLAAPGLGQVFDQISQDIATYVYWKDITPASILGVFAAQWAAALASQLAHIQFKVPQLLC